MVTLREVRYQPVGSRFGTLIGPRNKMNCGQACVQPFGSFGPSPVQLKSRGIMTCMFGKIVESDLPYIGVPE